MPEMTDCKNNSSVSPNVERRGVFCAVRCVLAVLAVMLTLENYVGTQIVDMHSLRREKFSQESRYAPEQLPLLRSCGWVNMPGTSHTETEAAETVWPNGQRASRRIIDKKASKRVLLAGCSYLFGMGLKDEETLAWLLGVKFPDAVFDNCGVPSYGTYQCMMTVDYMLQHNKYDLVLYMFIDDHVNRQHMWRSHSGVNLRHIYTIDPGVVKDGERLYFYPSSYFRWPGQYDSALIAFFNALYCADGVRRAAKAEAFLNFSQNRMRTAEDWISVKKMASRMEESCRSHGSGFAVVMLTPNTFVADGADSRWPCDYVDISFPGLESGNFRNQHNLLMHPNYAAQKCWLENITPWLEKKLR